MINIKVKVRTTKHKSKKSAPKKDKPMAEPVMSDVDDRADETVCPHCKEFIGYGDRDVCPHCGKRIDDRLL